MRSFSSNTKKKRIEVEFIADFASQLNRREIVSVGVGPQNEVLLLATTPVAKEVALGYDVQPGWASFPHSKVELYRADLLEFAPEFRGEISLETEEAHPFVQPLPQGEVLVVAARCYFRDGNPEQNATTYKWDGTIVRRFLMGDGLEHVAVAHDGSVWAGYFDEGIFGNYGWNQPLGAKGILRFDTNGEILWSLDLPSIADCYTLNVTPDAVWSCPYTDFPIVRIKPDGQQRLWQNEFSGARALTTDNHRVLLFGGYGENRSRCVVQDLNDEKMKNAREIELVLPFEGDLSRARVHNRGPILHLFVDTRWCQLDLTQHDV